MLNRLVIIFAILGFLGLPLEAKNRKAEKATKEALKAELAKDWDKALALFEEAYRLDPADTSYLLSVRRVRFQAGMQHVERGQKLRKEGKLEEALAEFQRGFSIDPSLGMAEQEVRRTYEMLQREKKGEESGQPSKPEDRGLSDAQRARREMELRTSQVLAPPELRPLARTINNLKMNNQPVKNLYETVCKLAGINVLFDPDFLQGLQGKTYPIELNNVTIEEALDYLSLLTKAYYKAISANAIFVTKDDVGKRREFEDQVVKTFYLQNVTAPQELQEISTAVRAVTEIRRLLTYGAQMAIMVRGTTDQVALAQKLILDMDKPKAEVVIDVMVMEANRTKTRDLAAALASGGAPGLKVPISFTPGGSGAGGGGSASGSTAATSSGITLAKIPNLTTNDWSLAMPGAVITAIMSDRQTRVLQNPQVRTIDSQKATLKIGDRYPYATGSFQPGGIGVGVSPLVSTQFQFAEVGVNLDVTPKVHGDEISMHVEIEVSNIRDQIDVGGLTQPVIGQRKIIEDIRLKAGEVNVIGGLTGLLGSRNVNGLPGLANVPGLGYFFGSRSIEDGKNELLIVLVPRVVRGPDLNEVNMRGVAAGNDQTVKLSYAPRPEEPKPATPAKPPEPPATVPQTAPVPMNPAAPVSPVAPPPGFNPLGGMPTGPRVTMRPSATQVAVSAPITITVEAANMADLMSAPMRLRYDKSVLRLVEVARGSFLSQDGQGVNFQRDLEQGRITLARLPGAGGISGNGPLLTLTFVAIGKGTSAIGFDEINLQNAQQQPMAVTLPEVSITVQ